MMPVSALWAGEEMNTYLNGPPLFYAISSGNTPFRFTSHINDVGHTLVVGPTGSGKSVLLSLMALQFLRYPDAQVYFFDKGASALSATAGVKGDFYDLGAESSELSFQPLSEIDKDSELSWAFEWIIDLLILENVDITPGLKKLLWSSLSSLATAPRKQRTITGLIALVQDRTIREALTPYSLRGAHGRLLDSTHDGLNYCRWQCFEMEEIMNTPRLVPPVLMYLFHRLENRFKESYPSLLILDEAWLFLDNPFFSEKIREWLKVLRKKNVSVIFATQSLSDIVSSSLFNTIVESCPTRVFLPNSGAFDETTRPLYQKFGLNERQIEILAKATPKRDYYYSSPQGNRVFQLGLGPFALSFCSSDNSRILISP
jgi:type IV secretory pathway VirB4 component